MKHTDAQWTVEKIGRSEDGGAIYEMQEVATGKTKKITADGARTAIMEQLAKDKIDMLKRLADR
ncbi:MAG: hypothetical protein GQ535_01675 [Rhodobacteraceae bacterium]|nr:hypothetical protein [Paracoccaceae bacterium]